MAADSDILHPEARIELREAVVWYREKGADAPAFVAEIARVIGELVTSPERWPSLRNVKPVTRYRVLPKQYPYTIFYRQSSAGILVLAVAHQKRAPLYWTHRKLG